MSVKEELPGGGRVGSLFCLEKTDFWPLNSQWIKGLVSEGQEYPNGLLTLRHETLGGRPRDRSLFLFCRNRLLALGLPWILEKGGRGSKVYSLMFCSFSNLWSQEEDSLYLPRKVHGPYRPSFSVLVNLQCFEQYPLSHCLKDVWGMFLTFTF